VNKQEFGAAGKDGEVGDQARVILRCTVKQPSNRNGDLRHQINGIKPY
jgi:hypothetical protein